MTGSEIDFERPPLIETVVGVQFDQIPHFSNAHLGAFWKRLGAEWPHIADAAPLEPQFERFGPDRPWRRLGDQSFQFTSNPAGRVLIRNLEKDRMIQLQDGALHVNWLGNSGGHYIRYGAMRAAFLEVLSDFRTMLSAENLTPFVPNQWEVTYLNQIPKGTVWEARGDWPSVCPMVSTFAPLSNTSFEGFGGAWHYEILPEKGRLHVEVQHGYQDTERQIEVLILKIVARGPIKEGVPVEVGIEEGIDLGHATIVKSFCELTSQEAQAFWRRC